MTTTKQKAQIFSLLLFFIPASFAFGGGKRLSPELDAKRAKLGSQTTSQSSAELIDVIVQVRPGASLGKHRQKMLGLGAAQGNSLDIINGTVFRIPASMLPVLEQ
ncbi:MAG: hypothetical protein ACXV5R_08125, partial [Candidatus Angelobacter sp.]